MRDAMVALRQHGIESAALVHRHSWSLTTLRDKFSANGHDFPLVRTGRWAHLAFTPISPTLPWHLWRLIRSFKPDILHLHLPNPSVFWVLSFPTARRLPWVVHWHADVISTEQGWLVKLLYRLYRPFERAVLRAADAIVVTSQPYLEHSEPLQEFESKCKVVPLGVDVRRFRRTDEPARREHQETSWTDKLAGRKQKGFPTTESSVLHETSFPTTGSSVLRVLAVGRLTYYKGFRYLIEAAARCPNIRVDIVGRGDEADKLQALTTSLNLKDRVTFHGVLSDAELVQQMHNCDCLCLPSIERTEAFGIVLLEAMYFGKASIISDLPGSGMGWIVDDGITGIKVRPADAHALAAALGELDIDRENLLTMGQRGKEKFTRQFEISHVVKGLVEVYENVTFTDATRIES